jgi:chemotaxis protein MotA
MKLILSLAFILGCVLGGFMLHHGRLALLVVPTEYLIIGGTLIGSVMIGNPGRVVKALLRETFGQVKGNAGPTRKQYVEMLQMVYELLQLARKEGVLVLEGHVNEPHESPIMTKYPSFLKNHHALAFFCDTLKLFVAGVLDPHNMDELMERDLETIHHEELEPATALQKAADSLPALGIVAAVLGIILTMQAIDQGAAAVGRNVAGALVGTFFGVFLAYGFVGPLACAVEAKVHANGRYLQCLRHALAASIAGVTPPMAVEMGRRSIYSEERPSFEELEEALKEVKKG